MTLTWSGLPEAIRGLPRENRSGLPRVQQLLPSLCNHHPENTMPDYGDLTDLQLMIMSVLWNEHEATIGTIHERLSERGPVTRKTIAMILSRLEQRGLVKHHIGERAGLYQAKVGKQSVLRSRMASLLGAVFVGQPRMAGAHALDPADVRAGDVEQLVSLMRQLERDVKKPGGK